MCVGVDEASVILLCLIHISCNFFGSQSWSNMQLTAD